MEKISSTDGTTIAYERTGSGMPLVLVHGTGGAYTRWAPIQPALEKHFSVYAIDRRGRGESTEVDSYAIEREFEDVAAVVDSTGEPVNLLGHSFGGICALEATLLTENLRKLVLYEPPIPIEEMPLYPEGVIERLQSLLDKGDREGVLTTFMLEVVEMPAHEFEVFQSSPAWPDRVAAAHTLPREVRAHEAYRFDADRFQDVDTPTLLLLGGDSPDFFKAVTAKLDAALSNTQIVEMPGQQHIAINTAPQMFADEVIKFLTEPS